LRNQMASECFNRAPALVFADHGERIIKEIHHCCGLDKANTPTTNITLTTSGTDSHRKAIDLLREPDKKQSWCILMVDAAETGRGVPDALSTSDANISCHAIAIRDQHGMPYASAIIDASAITQTEQAIRQQKKVLFVMVDQSKSGCIAPSLSCALHLQQRFPDKVHILLDACQFRIANTTLHTYLKHGMMVAITGSKFLAGPSFSAALLVPGSSPAFDSALKMSPSIFQPGLLIRWQIALTTWQSFLALDAEQARCWLEQCEYAIEQRLASDNIFSRLPSQNIRQNINTIGWDKATTIFPFMISQPCSGSSPVYADFATTLAIYQKLQRSGKPRIQLGRPIHAGQHANGTTIGALRLCISAPMIIDTLQQQKQHESIDQIMSALDHIADIAQGYISNSES